MIISIEPRGTPRVRAASRGRFTSIYYPEWYQLYMKEIKRQADGQGFVLGNSFQATFYFVPPKSTSKKKYALMIGTPHDKKPDLDNLAKGLIDALRPGDDQTIHRTILSKEWAESEGIEVTNNL
jgi:Holliday junction resolvase RusA-like endonuclease